MSNNLVVARPLQYCCFCCFTVIVIDNISFYFYFLPPEKKTIIVFAKKDMFWDYNHPWFNYHFEIILKVREGFKIKVWTFSILGGRGKYLVLICLEKVH